jgi:hypothetical protein
LKNIGRPPVLFPACPESRFAVTGKVKLRVKGRGSVEARSEILKKEIFLKVAQNNFKSTWQSVLHIVSSILVL